MKKTIGILVLISLPVLHGCSQADNETEGGWRAERYSDGVGYVTKGSMHLSAFTPKSNPKYICIVLNMAAQSAAISCFPKTTDEAAE